MSAAVVIVQGSGQEKRMLKFAARLAGSGIAVLTYDKRGIEESRGVHAGPKVGTNNIEAANLDRLAGDASAAINALSARLPAKSGPVITAREQLRFQFFTQIFTQGKADFWERHTEEEAREHLRNAPDQTHAGCLGEIGGLLQKDSQSRP